MRVRRLCHVRNAATRQLEPAGRLMGANRANWEGERVSKEETGAAGRQAPSISVPRAARARHY
jgi:hypothetical protein